VTSPSIRSAGASSTSSTFCALPSLVIRTALKRLFIWHFPGETADKGNGSYEVTASPRKSSLDAGSGRAQTFTQPARDRMAQNNKGRAMGRFELALRGYSLTTADIYYHLPDRPVLLQRFIWQEFDLAPRFPALNAYLRFWQNNLDGKLHSVRIASCSLISNA